MDEEVVNLLKTWNLEEYTEVFAKNKISLDCLGFLDDNMIVELFPIIGDRAIFKKNFENWKSIASDQVSEIDVDILSENHRNPFSEMTNMELFLKNGDFTVTGALMDTEAEAGDQNAEAIMIPLESKDKNNNGDCLTAGALLTPLSIPCTSNAPNQNSEGPVIPSNINEGNKNKKLLDLLQSSVDGKTILSMHQENGLLSSCSRSKLCNIIIKDLLGNDPMRTNIPSSVLFDMASQIKEIFNKENISTYFIPYINNKKLKIKRCAKGKLYDCLHNRKREYRIAERKILKMRMRSSSTDITESNEMAEPETVDVSDDMAWIKASTEPWKLLEQKWQNTSKSRLEEAKNLSITQYMAQYPGLKKPTGYHLLSIDFDVMYPEATDNLYKYFMLSKKSILELANTKYKSNKSMDEAMESMKDKSQGGNAEEAENIDAFFMLSLLVGQPMLKKPKKRCWRPSKQECKDGFITHVSRQMDLQETITQRREKYLQYGLTFQPSIFIVGETIRKIEQYFVVVDNTFYTVHSIVQAVDICFKSFQALHCEYPFECETVWLFIQKGFYKIKTSYDKEFVSVNSLLSDLHLILE